MDPGHVRRVLETPYAINCFKIASEILGEDHSKFLGPIVENSLPMANIISSITSDTDLTGQMESVLLTGEMSKDFVRKIVSYATPFTTSEITDEELEEVYQIVMKFLPSLRGILNIPVL